MAKDDLTGNMATENLLQYFEDKNINLSLDKIEFDKAMNLALKIFK